ncbi:MAG: ribosome-associated translation inhibitor RaiA [Chloroflexi bacterium]|nr:ribosome-associated translation inhibitor RaiA [Chloroflexota bacterium]
MKLNIQTHNVELTDWLEEYVEKKIGKLDKYLADIDEARVELRQENTRSAADREICQVTIYSRGTILRAEERSGDMFASIDAVSDKLERRIARYKGKNARNSKRAVAQFNMVEEAVVAPPVDDATEGIQIARVKRFEMQSMDVEEAVEQMEMLGHDFYIFLNGESGSVNVVYRRRENSYGLLQPVLG